MRITNREIRNYTATDITNWANEDVKLLARIQPLSEIAYSCGTYGCNGIVVIDNATGERFKVTKRNANLFILM